MTYAAGLVMPTMTCLVDATGAVSIAVAVAAVGVAARAVRSPAMMKAIPPMKSATLIANNQFTVFIFPRTPLCIGWRSYSTPLLVEEPFIENRKQNQRQGGGTGKAADHDRCKWPLDLGPSRR